MANMNIESTPSAPATPATLALPIPWSLPAGPYLQDLPYLWPLMLHLSAGHSPTIRLGIS